MGMDTSTPYSGGACSTSCAFPSTGVVTEAHETRRKKKKSDAAAAAAAEGGDGAQRRVLIVEGGRGGRGGRPLVLGDQSGGALRVSGFGLSGLLGFGGDLCPFESSRVE
mmetsp:Transcript_19960/g.57827  ORF Transcript_19960/g.57827 Transcript_19960/m.57827 type:complete len:109 (-) Transcript_19960:4-330(-)